MYTPLHAAILCCAISLCSIRLATAQSANTTSIEADKPLVRVDEQLGATLLQGWSFLDHTGVTVTGDTLFNHGKPTILTFVYYRCPAACTLLLDGLSEAIKAHEFRIGHDFNVVTISVDARETSDLATAKRETYLAGLSPGQGHDVEGWRFLTASRDTIEAITNAAGYRFTYNPDLMQYDHPSVLMFVSPTGELRRYLYGSYFQPKNVRLAFIEAGEGTLGSFTERLSVHFYDFGTPELGRRYVLNETRLYAVFGGGSAALALLVGLGIYLIRRRAA